MRGSRLRATLAALALCAWCGWVSGFHRATVAAEVTWACSVAAVVVVDLLLDRGRSSDSPWHLEPAAEAWPRPGRGGPARSLVGVAPWLGLGLVVVAWDVLGLATGTDQPHQTISALSQAYRPLNAALLAAWMLAGVGYQAARVRAPVRPLGAAPRATGLRSTVPSPRSPGSPGSPGDPGSGSGSPGEPGGPTALAAAGGPLGLHAGQPALLLPRNPAAGVAFWIAAPIVAVALDLVARRSGDRVATAEELVRFVSTPVWARVVLIAAWLAAGYHLFAR